MLGNPELLTVEDHKQGSREFYAAFPDMRHTFKDIIAKGDRVIVRTTNRGTHSGEFMGIQLTGKNLSIQGLEYFVFQKGREWSV